MGQLDEGITEETERVWRDQGRKGDGRLLRPSPQKPANSSYFFIALFTLTGFPSMISYSTASPVFRSTATTFSIATS